MFGGGTFEEGGKAWCSGQWCNQAEGPCRTPEIQGRVIPIGRAEAMKLPIARLIGHESNLAIICESDCSMLTVRTEKGAATT